MNKNMLILLVAGIFLYGLWFALIFSAIPKKEWEKRKGKLDERQMAERGIANKWAYITLICYLVIFVLTERFSEVKLFDTGFAIFLGIFLSVTVYGAYIIIRDACFTIKDNKRLFIMVWNFICLMQLVMGIEYIANGELIENGMITIKALYLLVAAWIILMDICLIIRRHLDGKNA